MHSLMNKVARQTAVREKTPVGRGTDSGGAAAGITSVSSLQELPEWSRNITDMRVRGEDGGKAFSDSIRRILAVLLLAESETRAIIVLNGDGAQSSDDYRTARSILRARGLELAGTFVVPPAVFDGLASNDSDEGVIEVRDAAVSQQHFLHIVEAATTQKASDVHICVRERSAKVLARIHGRLVPLAGMSDLRREDAIQAVAVAYNKLAVTGSQDKTHGQFSGNYDLYCMIDRHIRTGRWRIRYQSIRAEGGFDVVLRLLPGEAVNQNKTLADLGYEASQIEDMALGLMKRAGAILFAGETGAGKSTTIMVAMTMDPDRKFMKSYTIEDPVEFRMYGVTQYPVPRDIAAGADDDASFAAPMRVLMRGDPDIIMVGEIRDKTTGDLFIPMVLSGHRALSTVHSSSGFGTITRLASAPILMPRSVLAQRDFIAMLVHQALVPTLCEKCAVPAAGVLSTEYLQFIEDRFSVSTAKMRVSSGTSCGAEGCHGGCAGRTVAAEIVLPTAEMRRLILDERETEAEEVWRRTRKAGFDDPDMRGKTAFEHALYKSLQGIIDPRDVEKAFESFRTYEVIHPEG